MRSPQGGGIFNTGAAALVRHSPAGKIAAIANSNTIELLDIDQSTTIQKLTGHESVILDLSFAPSGKFLASASGDHTIRIWEVPSGNLLLVLTGHGDAVSDIEFSHDGNFLASASYDHTASIWDISRVTRE